MRIVVVAPSVDQRNSVTAAFLEQLQQEVLQTDHSLEMISDNTRNSISRFFFTGFRLPALIKKLNADIVIQLTGAFLKQTIPQIFVLSTRTVLPQKAKFFWEKKTFAERVRLMQMQFAFVSSDIIQQKLSADYGIEPRRTAILFSSAGQPLDWQQREHIKQSFTPEGSEYFYSDARFATKQEIIDLLKAFSVFKKWQRSSMHLIIRVQNTRALEEELSTYKFRGDVTLTKDEDALPAAYAVVQCYDDVNAAAVAKASAVQVACITVDSEDLPSERNDLFLVVKNETEYIGQAMISLYKNEQRRNNLALAAYDHYTKNPVSILDILSRFKK